MGKKIKFRSHSRNLEPLKGVSSPVSAVNEDIIKESELNQSNVGAVIIKKVHQPNKTILPHLDYVPSQTPVSNVLDISKDEKPEDSISELEVVSTSLCKDKDMSSIGGLEISVVPTKQLDESVFTFCPKVSKASRKIAENLGSDFMTRQQQHIDRQKKLVSLSFVYSSNSCRRSQSRNLVC